MFRCITELRGMIVDVDSFALDRWDYWKRIDAILPCVFITTDKDAKTCLNEICGIDRVLLLNAYERSLVPNKSTHIKALHMLGICNTELAYLSHDWFFIEKANAFLCGSIWVHDRVSYKEASNLADIIVNHISELPNVLRHLPCGFIGELSVSPMVESMDHGNIVKVEFDVGDDTIPVYVLGRYYGYSHYMNQLHPYSSAIFLNKAQERPYTGIFNNVFGAVYENALRMIKSLYNVDAVCAVPVKPNKPRRFDSILDRLSRDGNIKNIGERFFCVKEYEDQKRLLSEERETNVKNAFRFEGDLSGMTIVLIDDIVSTGTTLRECVLELKNKRAENVICIVLAVNQLGNYWSNTGPMVNCPTCGAKMKLLLNSKRQFFYSCVDCYSSHRRGNTKCFAEGWQQVCENENNRFK